MKKRKGNAEKEGKAGPLSARPVEGVCHTGCVTGWQVLHGPLSTLPLLVLIRTTLIHQIVRLLPRSTKPLLKCRLAQKGISRLPLTPHPASIDLSLPGALCSYLLIVCLPPHENASSVCAETCWFRLVLSPGQFMAT